MFIHTSALHRDDFYQALPDGVAISHFSVSESSRSHDRRYEIRLTGSNKSMQAGGTGFKAATYEEWGEWIAYLYVLDPFAKCGGYKNRTDFHAKTENAFLKRHPDFKPVQTESFDSREGSDPYANRAGSDPYADRAGSDS